MSIDGDKCEVNRRVYNVNISCYNINKLEQEGAQKGGGINTANDLASWVSRRCQQEGLSLRQASLKAGLCHATVAAIVRGGRPSPETIRRLVHFFSQDGAGSAEIVALEDHILTLAGYRLALPEATKSETLRRIEAKLTGCEEPKLALIEQFIEYLNSLGGQNAEGNFSHGGDSLNSEL